MAKQRGRKTKLIIAVGTVLVILAAITLWAVLSDDSGSFDNTLGGIAGETPVREGLILTFLDVGQGDCIFAECGGQTMLIDAGEKAYEQTVSKFLNSRGIKTLDYVIATHPHSDHIGSLAYVIDTFGANHILMPRIPAELIPTNVVYDEFLTAVSDSGAEVTAAEPGVTFTLGEAVVRVIAPVLKTAESLNDMSAVVTVTYGETSAILTGDASFAEEMQIISSGANIDCDLMKLGHHGSASATSEEFIEKVSPRYCVISCGAGNDYGHPADSTLGRVSKYTDKIYRTDRCGTITASSDGKDFTFEWEKS